MLLEEQEVRQEVESLGSCPYGWDGLPTSHAAAAGMAGAPLTSAPTSSSPSLAVCRPRPQRAPPAGRCRADCRGAGAGGGPPPQLRHHLAPRRG